ncbi:hypothetical protein M407DRAFT_32245 [Tulasnella calospora MUT 4182]|uniref:Uncharacterized protein n=1 Tax=Tulasnella calospora MUT 4182 TaxID=1051891 RepID=A0A0C3PTG6_9AGAM|nr:hypothetical protein M407DRAFT_32245 [Tulasnella calospora MUT 4182]
MDDVPASDVDTRVKGLKETGRRIRSLLPFSNSFPAKLDQSSEPGRDDILIEAETATRWGDLPSKPVVGTDDLSKALEANEVAFLVNHGQNTISLYLHARHLEFLLNQTFVGTDEPKEENILRLEKYLHIYCARKLHSGLNIQWLGQRVRFLDLFNLKSQLRTNVMSRERVQQLALAEISAEFLEDVGLQWKKEDWLYDVLKQWGINPQLESGNDPDLVLMASLVFHLYYFFAAHLSNVHQSLKKLFPLLPGVSDSVTATEQKIEDARITISLMANSLLIINRLTRNSRSFWRVPNTLGPLFFDLLATGENHSATRSSESAPPDPHNQPSFEPIIPIDKSDRNRAKYDDTSANTQPEKLDNILGSRTTNP